MAPIEWVSVNWDSTCKHILLLLITSFESPLFWNDLLSVDLSQGEVHIDCVIQLVYARFLQCKSVISPFICDYYLRETHGFSLHTIWPRSMQRIWVVGANRDREKQIQIAPLIHICGKSLKWRSKPLFWNCDSTWSSSTVILLVPKAGEFSFSWVWALCTLEIPLGLGQVLRKHNKHKKFVCTVANPRRRSELAWLEAKRPESSSSLHGPVIRGSRPQR